MNWDAELSDALEAARETAGSDDLPTGGLTVAAIVAGYLGAAVQALKIASRYGHETDMPGTDDIDDAIALAGNVSADLAVLLGAYLTLDGERKRGAKA